MPESAARYFTSQHKARVRLVASAGMVAASTVPFAVGLLGLTHLVPDATGWAAWTLTAGVLVASSLLTWAAQNLLAMTGNARLRADLAGCAAECQALAGSAEPPVFVGFTPSDEYLAWEGDTDLDVGFLCVTPEALIYKGDRFEWALPRDHVERVELSPALVAPRRVIIRWHPPREAARALTLESREARSLRGAERQTLRLHETLRQWAEAERGEAQATPFILPQPPTERYGGRPLDQPAAGWCGTVLGMTVIVVVTVWYLAQGMIREGLYCHAVLWAGFVFVGGAVFTRCLLQYMEGSEHPRGTRRPRRA